MRRRKPTNYGHQKTVPEQKGCVAKQSQNEKILIELGDFEPLNIIANYKKLKVMARIDAKLVPVVFSLTWDKVTVKVLTMMTES